MPGYKRKAKSSRGACIEHTGPSEGDAKNNDFATLRRTTIKTWGAKEELKSKDERMEEQVPIKSLVTEGTTEVASVTASVATKMSDAVHYAPGTWDKIPFSVEIFSSVTLKCDQSEESVRAAHGMAYDLAWDSSREHIMKAVAGHVVDIKTRLCAGYFTETE